jgi:hypothetical protein
LCRRPPFGPDFHQHGACLCRGLAPLGARQRPRCRWGPFFAVRQTPRRTTKVAGGPHASQPLCASAPGRWLTSGAHLCRALASLGARQRPRGRWGPFFVVRQTPRHTAKTKTKVNLTPPPFFPTRHRKPPVPPTRFRAIAAAPAGLFRATHPPPPPPLPRHRPPPRHPWSGQAPPDLRPPPASGGDARLPGRPPLSSRAKGEEDVGER